MTTLVMAAMVIFGAVGYSSLPVSDLPNIDFPTISVTASLPAPIRHHGLVGRLAAGKPVLDHQRHRPDDVVEHPGHHHDQPAVQPGPQPGRARRWMCSPPSAPPATSCPRRCRSSPPSARSTRPTCRSCSSPCGPTPSSRRTWTNMPRPCSPARSPPSKASPRSACSVPPSSRLRVQADPYALAGARSASTRWLNAVSAANVNLATGALNGPTRSTVIHTGGQLNNAAEFNDQIIAFRNGAPVRLKDVARVIDGQENPYGKSWYKDQPAIVLALFRQPGSNVVEVIDTIKKVLPQFQANLPPSVKLDVVFDRSQMIKSSINDVQETLIIAAVLGGGRDLRLPAPRLRHHHPVPGAAHRGDRDFRRHVADGLQSRQSLADGADAVGRLCRGRRHRHAGEYRPPYRAGQEAL